MTPPNEVTPPGAATPEALSKLVAPGNLYLARSGLLFQWGACAGASWDEGRITILARRGFQFIGGSLEPDDDARFGWDPSAPEMREVGRLSQARFDAPPTPAQLQTLVESEEDVLVHALRFAPFFVASEMFLSRYLHAQIPYVGELMVFIDTQSALGAL